MPDVSPFFYNGCCRLLDLEHLGRAFALVILADPLGARQSIAPRGRGLLEVALTLPAVLILTGKDHRTTSLNGLAKDASRLR